MIEYVIHSTAYPFPRFPPHMSPDDESDEEGQSLSGDDTEPLPLTPEPDLTPYPDPERRDEATKKRKYVLSHDSHVIIM